MGRLNLSFAPKHLFDGTNEPPQFVGGDKILIEVSWFEKYPLERFILSLIRHTTGKGSSSSDIAHTVDVDTFHVTGKRLIEIHLPDGPATYQGKLLSISWCVQASLSDSESCEKLPFILRSAPVNTLLSDGNNENR